MKKTVFMPIAAIILAAAILLGLSFGLKGVAEEKAQAEHIRLLKTLLPGSESFILEKYTGDDENIVSVHKGETGFVVETEVYGYAGNIRMLIGVNNDGKVVSLTVRNMEETFTLGAEALTNEAFLAQFLNKEGGSLEVGTDINAITGATVTSKAIVRAINSASAYVTGADIESGATSWGG